MEFDKDKLKSVTAGAVDRIDNALDVAVDLVHDVTESTPAREAKDRVRRGAGRGITAAKKGIAEVRRRARLLEEKAAASAGRSRTE